MNYTTLIFDWDGTIIDSVDRIAYCLEKTIDELGYQYKTKKQIKSIIGLGLNEAIVTLIPEVRADLSKLDITIDTYRKYFFSKNINASFLFDGTIETLDFLKNKGYELAIATGKSLKGLNMELDNHGIKEYFKCIRTADKTKSKPDPLMLYQILDELQCNTKSALMIGDTTFDLEMANNANIACLGLTSGVHSKAQLEVYHPIKILTQIREIQKYF